MRGVHSFWSRPNAIRHQERVYMPDFELLVLMLSALKWQEKNGSIRMITDKAGYEFFCEKGLKHLWSEPIDDSLEEINQKLKPMSFWAGGKLYALEKTEAPCAMLDTDLIFWESIEEYLDSDIVAAHEEELNDEVYPDAKKFTFHTEYHYPEEWDFQLRAANTAFLYIKDSSFKSYYVNSAMEFMQALDGENVSPIVSMCFAEQRILPMCAKKEKKQLRYLFGQDQIENQNLATHLWGYKNALLNSWEERTEFCVLCIQRLLRDFPEWKTVIEKNPQLQKYLFYL